MLPVHRRKLLSAQWGNGLPSPKRVIRRAKFCTPNNRQIGSLERACESDTLSADDLRQLFSEAGSRRLARCSDAP